MCLTGYNADNIGRMCILVLNELGGKWLNCEIESFISLSILDNL